MNNVRFVSQFFSQRDRIWVLLVLALAAFFLYLPSENACAIAIPPDSSEYSIGLVNLFEHGKFGFTLNGVWYPSRYAPWFSLTCLTPAYLLSGGNPLCFHWAILVFSLAVLFLMVKWGERIGLGRWSIASAILLLFLPDFAFYSRIVMTEIPYVAIFAASALVWLRFAEKGAGISLKFCLGAGTLVAWGGMVRPTMLPMLLPFVVVIWMWFPWRERFMRWIALAIPSVAYECANLAYNKLVFGSFSRSGYHYWVSVPCDFPHLLFNWENVSQNITGLVDLPIVRMTFVMLLVSLVFSLFVVRGYLGGLKQNRTFLRMLGYLCFQFGVLVALYASYYWTDSRFYLVISICVVPLFLYSCWRMFSCLPLKISSILFIFVVLFSGWFSLSARPKYRDQPLWRQVWLTKGRISRQVLPEHSVVIQFGDPNVLDYFCLQPRGLIHFPYGRICDYELYMTAPISIRHQWHPTSSYQVYIPELVRRGICQTPFPVTFKEDAKQVKKFLDEGQRVFIEQQVLEVGKNMEFIQRELKKIGLTMKPFGGWAAPELKPNPLRHCYDTFALGDCLMDSRPEVSAVFHEIVRLEDVAQ